jgi:predicted nicotinamide N-methyase
LPKRETRVIVEVTIKDRNLAARFSDGSLAEYLTLLGPVSRRVFGEDKFRTIDVALPQLGLWAQWKLRERQLLDCGEGGMTWAMSVVLANYLGAAPEYPRLRILELGAGTGLVSLALAGRGHSVVATDGDRCVLENLQRNVHIGLGNAVGSLYDKSWELILLKDQTFFYGFKSI